MQKMNYPKGLIRYTTENLLNNQPSRVVRLRSVIYTLILLVLISSVAFAILNRNLVEMDLSRDRNVLYREVADGAIENVFSARILNKDQKDHRYRFEVLGLDEAKLLVDSQQAMVPSGAVSDATLTIRAQVDFTGSRKISIRIVSEDDAGVFSETEAKFISP